MKVDAAWAKIPRRGESVCGDDVLVVQGRVALVVVADGLGHGPDAAVAARGLTSLASEMAAMSPRDILLAASKAMAGTRGSAGLVAKFDCEASILAVAGIGNIETRSVSRTPIQPVSTPGIVGRPVRSVREFAYSLVDNDLVVFTSDGVSRRYDVTDYVGLAPQQMADAILQDHAARHDDATCVVVRVLP